MGPPAAQTPKTFPKKSESQETVDFNYIFLTFQIFFLKFLGVWGRGGPIPLSKDLLRLFGVSEFRALEMAGEIPTPTPESSASFAFLHLLGKSKRGLANGGLAQKAPMGPKRPLSGEFLLPPRGCEVRRNRSRSAPKRPR